MMCGTGQRSGLRLSLARYLDDRKVGGWGQVKPHLWDYFDSVGVQPNP